MSRQETTRMFAHRSGSVRALHTVSSIAQRALIAAVLATLLPSHSFGTTLDHAQRTTTTRAPMEQAVRNNRSNYDATEEPIRLTGTIVREEKTREDTLMGWSAVVYWLVPDNSVRISYLDAIGEQQTNTFSRIAVYALEQYGDQADQNLSSITDSYWQPYVGKKVTVKGALVDTGNAHSFGYARFEDPHIVSKGGAKQAAINFVSALYDDWRYTDGVYS